jgi:8-oxo-dGTP pyrophosphatase MutT (NUDIX family)
VSADPDGTPSIPASAFVFEYDDPVYDGWLIRVAHAHFRDPEGAEFDRDIVHHPGAVAVIPVDEDGVVTLVRQYRPAIGDFVLEIPAGTCDVNGEDRASTARRELAEEVGLRAEEMSELATVFNSPGYTDQRTTIYLATGLSPCETNRSGVEERWLTLVRRPLDSLVGPGVAGAAEPGSAADATTVVAAHLAAAARAARHTAPGS